MIKNIFCVISIFNLIVQSILLKFIRFLSSPLICIFILSNVVFCIVFVAVKILYIIKPHDG